MSELMSKDQLWQAVESLSRLLGEAHARQLPPDLTHPLDLARAVALGLYGTADAYSVKVPDVMPERFLIGLPGGQA